MSSIFLNFIPDFFFQSTLSLVFLTHEESRRKLCQKLSLHGLSMESNSLQ